MQAKSLQLGPTLCDPMDYSLPGSSVYEILPARILERVACLLTGNLPDAGIEPVSLKSPALTGKFLTTGATWDAQKYVSKCNYIHT